MHQIESKEVTNIADAISRYLSARPHASETVEGVAKWWLLRQRYADSLELVQDALNYLEERGEVVKLCVSGGKVMYRKASLN